MTNVNVQQELLWMTISGYKHEKNKQTKKKKTKKKKKRKKRKKEKKRKKKYLIYLKRKWSEGTDFGSSSQAILHFYLWTAFRVLVVRKKKHESNTEICEIVHEL